MLCPALGNYPRMGSDDLVLKLTPTGVTYLHQRRFKNRYTGSKTCAVDINGALWPKSSDHTKVAGRKFSKDDKYRKAVERSIATDQDGNYFLNGFEEPKSKGKKKAAMPGCLNVIVTDPVLKGSSAISEQNLTPSNNSANNLQEIAKTGRKKSYSINKKEVRQRILSYLNTQKGQKELFFWTVTFPAGTPDNVCYQAFNTWLTTLRTRQKDRFGKLMPAMLRDYLWVAERQMGERLTSDKTPTYTIHFHIAIPHYMPVTRSNTAMRTILKNLAKKGLMPGAVCGKNGTRYYLPSIARYNGVHISRDRSGRVINFAIKKASRSLANYLTKYVTKNDAGVADSEGNIAVPGFSHLAWHNSRGFSCLFTGVTLTVSEFDAHGLRHYLNRVRKFSNEFATFVPWLFGPPPLLMNHLHQLNSYIQHLFDGKDILPPASACSN